MLGKPKKGKMLFPLLAMLAVLCFACLIPAPAYAAKLNTAAKPAFSDRSGYMDGKVYLKWGKIAEAKEYVIFRAKVNPKTGKIGSWSKWAETTKAYIRKKASGDYKYRVRAVNGKVRSKYSKAIRIFAADSVIGSVRYSQADSKMLINLKVTNMTKSEMRFMKNKAASNYNQYRVQALNPNTGSIVKTLKGNLYVNTIAPVGTANNSSVVNAGMTRTVFVQSAVISKSVYDSIKNCKFLVTAVFYPNPAAESNTDFLTISCTKNAAESFTAGK